MADLGSKAALKAAWDLVIKTNGVRGIVAADHQAIGNDAWDTLYAAFETLASTTVAGIIELATVAETDTGTATDRAVTPAGLATIQTDVDANTAKVTNATHTGDVTGSTTLTIAANAVNDTHIDWGTGANQVSTADVPEQTDLYYTEVRVAANSAVTANTAKDTNVSTNLTTTQTTTTVDVVSSDGTNATLPQAIAAGNAGMLSGADKTKLDATSGTNSGNETLSSINALAITTVGTIDTGVWNGTAINQTYLTGQSGTNTGDQTSIVGITGTVAQFNTAITDATLSGSNTGDQTSIVGLSGTIAQFNTAISDGSMATGGGTATNTNTGDEVAASTTVSGIQENATTAEVTTGTSTTRTITPDALKGSTVELAQLTTTGNTIVTGQAYSTMDTLTDAATVATDCDDGNVHEVTLEGNRTLGAPTNLKDGSTYIWIITQDGTGSRTLAYNAVFKFPGGTAPVLTTAASSIDILTGVSDGTNIYCTMQNTFS